MTTVIVHELKEPAIDHPSDNAWTNYVTIQPEVRDDIVGRFDGDEKCANTVLDAIERLSTHAKALRHTNELANLGALALNEERQREYRGLIQATDCVPEMISWFDLVARQSFKIKPAHEPINRYGHADNGRRVSKLALEASGVTQAGNWAHTTKYDELFRKLPETFDGQGSNPYVEAIEGIRSYTFLPHFSGGAFTVTRRRGVGDIFFPERDHTLEWLGAEVIPTNLFKISKFAVFPSLFSPEELEKFRELHKKDSKEGLNNFFGTKIESAIAEDGPHSRDIFPLSSQYVVFQERHGR